MPAHVRSPVNFLGHTQYLVYLKAISLANSPSLIYAWGKGLLMNWPMTTTDRFCPLTQYVVIPCRVWLYHTEVVGILQCTMNVARPFPLAQHSKLGNAGQIRRPAHAACTLAKITVNTLTAQVRNQGEHSYIPSNRRYICLQIARYPYPLLEVDISL